MCAPQKEFDVKDWYEAQSRALAAAGWDDPELDVYNDYDANRPPSALDPPSSAPHLADG